MPLKRLARLWMTVFAALAAIALVAPGVRAQEVPEEDRLKILTDEESVKKKVEKEKTRPPIEVFLSQVAPFDILPYVKLNHWSSITLEMRANYEDWNGSLVSAPVPLVGTPQEMLFRRDVRLAKTQRTRLGLQLLLPELPRDKELNFDLVRPDAIRADEIWPAPLRLLERQQMLIVVLSKEATDSYASWKRFASFYPADADRADVQTIEQRLFYRLVLPLDASRPMLSAHPLTWSPISHIVWDALPPDSLNPGQQAALLDWLHFGGQLVLVGGANPSFSMLQDSFLAPFLPAEETGENHLLKAEDLRPLEQEYPASRTFRYEDPDNDAPASPPGFRRPAPLTPPEGRPVYLMGLRPKPGSVPIPLGESGERLVGVERRVGRGRILMLAFAPNDPTIASWPGLDTFVRRVVLRRPEQSVDRGGDRRSRLSAAPRVGPLLGPDLTWVRYLTRDLGLALPSAPNAVAEPASLTALAAKKEKATFDPDDFSRYTAPADLVGAWVDGAGLPRICRDVLEAASGIKVPRASFVLKIILAYIIVLVPLNWLVCRYLFGRRELAWVVVPLLSLGFAIGVERAAAYDVGYNSSCDEIDVLEAYADYPRAHLTRFASLYSAGRTRYSIGFPDAPTALALPLDRGRSTRGEDVVTSTWQSNPYPSLDGFLVQPRSLSMFRAEEMLTLDGPISLDINEDGRRVLNGGTFDLLDAVLVDLSAPGERTETYLGKIPAGGAVDVEEASSKASAEENDPFDRDRLLRLFRASYENRPENAGEIRLVAWASKPVPGPKIDPPVDRHRGFTAVVVHLRVGPPPSPSGPLYNSRYRPKGDGPGPRP